MARSKDRILMVAAMAVTIILCVAGMYLLTRSSDNNEDVYVIVSSDIADEMRPILAEFETYAKANIHISVTEPAEFLSWDDGADVMISGDGLIIGPFDSLGIERSEIKISEDIGTMHLLYKPGTKEMTGHLINWLTGLADA